MASLLVFINFLVLFNDTIFNNIRYGRLDATAEEIYEAARIADLHNSVIGTVVLLRDKIKMTLIKYGFKKG